MLNVDADANVDAGRHANANLIWRHRIRHIVDGTTRGIRYIQGGRHCQWICLHVAVSVSLFFMVYRTMIEVVVNETTETHKKVKKVVP